MLINLFFHFIVHIWRIIGITSMMVAVITTMLAVFNIRFCRVSMYDVRYRYRKWRQKHVGQQNTDTNNTDIDERRIDTSVQAAEVLTTEL
jgi:hypothetical protein